MSGEKKVAVITGASQGIGEALVKAYLDRNYRVVATSRSIKPTSNADILAVPGDEAAHQVCPYSRATHGNIAVETTLL